MSNTVPLTAVNRIVPCVLVADDEPNVRDLIQEILEDAGYQVLTASDGEQAIQFLRRRSVDLFIVDLVMPEQEGIETISLVRQTWPEQKILAISGSGSLFLRVARLIGAQETLQKPFTVDALVEKVGALVDLPCDSQE